MTAAQVAGSILFDLARLALRPLEAKQDATEAWVRLAVNDALERAGEIVDMAVQTKQADPCVSASIRALKEPTP